MRHKLVVFLVLVFAAAHSKDDDYDPFNDDFEEDKGPMFASVDHEDEDNITSTEMPTTPEGSFTPHIAVDMVPVCVDGEFLRSNGSQLQCVEIPERVCRCPGPVVDPTEIPGTVVPTPPLGCPNMDPPKDGAFVCTIVESDAQIYCSVLCSPSSEFSSYPCNPYRCGVFTKFLWINFFNESFNQLPQCNGFRYSVDPVFDSDNYLPRACKDLTMTESDQVKRTFCDQIDLWYFLRCSALEDAYILCGQDRTT